MKMKTLLDSLLIVLFIVAIILYCVIPGVRCWIFFPVILLCLLYIGFEKLKIKEKP